MRCGQCEYVGKAIICLCDELGKESYMTKVFAEKYPRNEQGWVKYPRDVQYRKSLFPQGVFEHQAKSNLYMVESIVEYVSEPGETVLDPFAGTGTIMIAAHHGRNVVCVELEPWFADLIDEGKDKLAEGGGSVLLIRGDCRKILPVPVDHAIFSPPYASFFVGSGIKQEAKEKYAKYSGKGTSSALNMGMLPNFIYGQQMKRVYELLFRSIRPGGTLVVIHKDRKGTEKGESVRVFLSELVIREATTAGFILRQWEKWETFGTAEQASNKAKGFDVITDEDIIFFERPDER